MIVTMLLESSDSRLDGLVISVSIKAWESSPPFGTEIARASQRGVKDVGSLEWLHGASSENFLSGFFCVVGNYESIRLDIIIFRPLVRLWKTSRSVEFSARRSAAFPSSADLALNKGSSLRAWRQRSGKSTPCFTYGESLSGVGL